MKVTVRFFLYVSRITNTGELEVDLDEGAGLRDLLGRLSERFGPGFVEALYVSELGVVDPYTSVIVNGKAVLLTERTDVELQEGSIVAFLPPLGGG